LVAARLAGRSAITLDLALDAATREAGRGDHMVDRLLAAPPLVIHAGVDHEPFGTEQEALQIARPLYALVTAEFVRQLLGIKRPALAIGGVKSDSAKHRQLGR